MKLITAENIVAGYLPGINILNGIDFAAEQGEITTIIGANGAGKSTFLKALYGFLKPKTGKIFYKGDDITSQNPEFLIRKGISFVPQQTKSFFADMTVSANLEMGCWVRRNDKEFVKEAIERVYDNHAFIYEAKDVPAKLLSGGQQRILELERSMLLKPELLILDEPTATLSPKISDSIYELLLEMKKRDTTIVLVDQNVSKSLDRKSVV